MVKVIPNGQKIVVKKIPVHTRLIVTAIFLGILFLVAFSITYIKKTGVFASPTNYEECASKKSSIIQESYPSICITKDGKRFVQPLSIEEQKLLEVSIKPSSQSQAGKFCGGIAGLPCPTGFSCQLEGNYPDAGGKCVKN